MQATFSDVPPSYKVVGMFSLHYYEEKEDDHPEKTYDYLIKMISKHIKIKREEKNREANNQGLKHLASRHKSLGRDY